MKRCVLIFVAVVLIISLFEIVIYLLSTSDTILNLIGAGITLMAIVFVTKKGFEYIKKELENEKD